MKVQFHSFLTSVLNGGVINFTIRLLYPREITPLLADRRLGWLQRGICTFRRREKYFSLLGFKPQIVQPID
jgi:hypothetical protein